MRWVSTSFWHPFADMAAIVTNGATILERGDGAYVWDVDGNRYLDATASLWYCNVGWGRSEIADAAAAQLATLPAYSAFGDLSNRPAEALAEKVASIAPVADAKVFLTSGGSDSIDTATKMARRYWQLVDEPDRTVLIRRTKAYHGMHTAGTSLAGIPANATGHGDLIEDVAEVDWDSAEVLRTAIEEIGAEKVAAFFCEPVIGAGGVFPPPEGYLRDAREVCRETGVLFVADEVITGFGRCGDWFASSRWQLEPDIVTFAKGITSGYLPMGGVIAAPRIWQPFWGPGAGLWRHGYTYSGHAAVSAAALANLAIIERDDLFGRALQLEKDLAEALAPLHDHELVSEVRAGTGVLAAVQLDPERTSADPTLAAKVGAGARKAGVFVRPLVDGAIAVSPPLVIQPEDLELLHDGFHAGLDAAR